MNGVGIVVGCGCFNNYPFLSNLHELILLNKNKEDRYEKDLEYLIEEPLDLNDCLDSKNYIVLYDNVVGIYKSLLGLIASHEFMRVSNSIISFCRPKSTKLKDTIDYILREYTMVR